MKTIIAIQPDARFVAYTVFKGTTLVDKGSKHIALRKPLLQRTYQNAIPFFRDLIEHHKPDVVVLPNPTHTPETGRNRFLRAMKYETGRARHKYKVVSYGRKDIREMFKGFLKAGRAGKDSTMQLLTKWFPELLEFLPAPRRAWDPPSYWVRMFDAVSLAVTYLHHNIDLDCRMSEMFGFVARKSKMFVLIRRFRVRSIPSQPCSTPKTA